MLSSANSSQAPGEEQFQTRATSDALTMPPTIIDQWAGGWSDRLRIEVVHDRRAMTAQVGSQSARRCPADHTA